MRARLTLALFLAATPAVAQSPIAEVVCAPRDEMVQRLTGQYGAALRGIGVRDRDSVLEVWSADSGAWTLVMSYTNGQACILAMGEAWDTLPGPA